MVGDTDGPLEWENNPEDRPGVDYRIRRFNPGLGSNMSGFQYERAMVSTGEDVTHKLPRTSSATLALKTCEEKNKIVTTAVAYINNFQGGTIPKKLVSLA